MKSALRLTVFFDDPFWVGVFEKKVDNKLFVAKVTYGAEPKDAEVEETVLKQYQNLRFSPAVEDGWKDIKTNPKKRQRDAEKIAQERGIGTKAQQAMKLQQEQNKIERKVKSKEEKEAEAERIFELKQQKRKEKRKGR